MNCGEIIDQFRRISGDVIEQNYLCDDDEAMGYLNEAQDQAFRNGMFGKTSDLSRGETVAKATLTINGTSGSISQILVGTQNIIANPVNYTASNNITAQILANEINSLNAFVATVVNANVIISPLPGNGSAYNNQFPIVIQTENIATATPFTGGVDGPCRIQLLPNVKDYKFSSRILRFENFTLGDNMKPLMVKDYRRINDMSVLNQKGSVETIVYGMSTDSITVARTPTSRDYIRATIYHLPLKKLVYKSDVPELPEHLHVKLIDYMLFRYFSKMDSEVDATQLSDRHLKLFEKEFNDNQASTAYEQYNLPFFFGDKSMGY